MVLRSRRAASWPQALSSSLDLGRQGAARLFRTHDMATRAAIIVFLVVVLLILALAAYGYSTGRWKPNPPTVPPEQDQSVR